MGVYKHCIGDVNTENLHVKVLSPEQSITQKYENAISVAVLIELKKPEYREQLIKNNIAIVKKAISESVTKEQFIIQTINSIEELDRICNRLSKRIREWYGYYFPEAPHKIIDNEIFIRTIIEKDKNYLMKDFNIDKSMGPDIGQNEIKSRDIDKIIEYARQVQSMYDQRESLKEYLEELMKELCPNIYEVAGTLIGAKLLEKAGSLKHLSMMPSSTIQLLGAEKALFRHLRNKKIRPPKHGIILNHPYVLNSKDKGKAARQLAAKISIASKVDYFKGEFIGDKLKL